MYMCKVEMCLDRVTVFPETFIVFFIILREKNALKFDSPVKLKLTYKVQELHFI